MNYTHEILRDLMIKNLGFKVIRLIGEHLLEEQLTNVSKSGGGMYIGDIKNFGGAIQFCRASSSYINGRWEYSHKTTHKFILSCNFQENHALSGIYTQQGYKEQDLLVDDINRLSTNPCLPSRFYMPV